MESALEKWVEAGNTRVGIERVCCVLSPGRGRPRSVRKWGRVLTGKALRPHQVQAYGLPDNRPGGEIRDEIP
jgi:hypothetical protein